jgi:hypothetical protein
MIGLDEDRLLDLFGIVLVLAIVGALALIGLGVTSAPQESTGPPETDWTLTRVNESHVRVSHAGGEPVRADLLTVAVDGQPRRVQWTTTMLTQGESGAVRADEGVRVTLIWQRSEADRRILERWAL